VTSIIVYGVAILVLIASIIGGVAVHDHGIRAAQKTADEAAITAADNNTAICKAANVSLQASIEPIAKQRDEQTAKVAELDHLWRDAAELALGWRQKYYATQTALAKGQQDAHAKGMRPTDSTQTCQQQMDEMDADGKQFAMEREVRMRDILGLPAPVAKPDALKVGK
jgi:hypothetical protein